MYIGGLDIGTSGCKIVLYDENGNFVKKAYEEYNVKRNSGLHELDASAVFDSVKNILKCVASEEIKAIAVTTFGETFVMLDENDKPCAPTMLYTDKRGEDECDKLITKFGKENLARRFGTKVHTMYSMPKIMWIKKNMPENYAKTKCILLMEDFVVYMLSGVRQIDYSLASRTNCFDIEKKVWDTEILDFCGVDINLLSKPVPSGTIAGNIRPEIAKELGLSADTVIVSGCQDQIAAMIGAGAYDNNNVMDGTGTVECMPVFFDEIPDSYSLYDEGYALCPHINGKYACYVLAYAGGATLKWFRDSISEMPYAEMDKLVKEAPTDLLIMPHFAGGATPYMNIDSKAAILGLTFEHNKADIYKALMEGTAYEMKLNLDVIKKYGVEPKSFVATGGGANSPVWLQIKADVWGVPVTALKGEEIGGAGTAFLAGRAIGVYKDGMKLAETGNTFYPDEKRHEYYLKQLKKYKKIYNCVMEVSCDE